MAIAIHVETLVEFMLGFASAPDANELLGMYCFWHVNCFQIGQQKHLDQKHFCQHNRFATNVLWIQNNGLSK